MGSPKDRALRAGLEAGDRAARSAVLRALGAELGWLRAAQVLVRVAWSRARGEPFATLGPPPDERDRLSRRQCGPAVVLYRALLEHTTQPRARAITREAVIAGALPFLDAMIPPLSVSELAEQAPALAERFFNADGHTAVVDDGAAVTFDVHRCRFVELLSAVGASELTALFCEVDRMFFDGRRRPVAMYRRLTLAGGDDRCDFRFEPLDDDG